MKRLFMVLGFAFILAFVSSCNSGGGTTNTTNNNNQAITNPQTETPIEPTTGIVTLQNDCTTVAIERFYISPTTSSSWGSNRIFDPVAAGDSVSIPNLLPDNYDMMVIVETDSNYYSYLANEPIAAGDNIVVVANDAGFSGAIKIKNNTVDQVIGELYVTPHPVVGADWGPNLMDLSTPNNLPIIFPGQSFHVTDVVTNMGAGTYDVKAKWSTGHVDTIFDVVVVDPLTLTELDFN